MMEFGDSVRILIDLPEENIYAGRTGFVSGVQGGEYPIAVCLSGDDSGDLYGFKEEELTLTRDYDKS